MADKMKLKKNLVAGLKKIVSGLNKMVLSEAMKQVVRCIKNL